MIQYAETLLGAQNHEIKCMDQSSCQELFPQSELERFLSGRLMDLYLRIKQRKEIAAAGLSGLEECPFCEFKVVIENEHEKLFRCQNEECLSVSCRQCKKAVSLSIFSGFIKTSVTGPLAQILQRYVSRLPFIRDSVSPRNGGRPAIE